MSSSEAQPPIAETTGERLIAMDARLKEDLHAAFQRQTRLLIAFMAVFFSTITAITYLIAKHVG